MLKVRAEISHGITAGRKFRGYYLTLIVVDEGILSSRRPSFKGKPAEGKRMAVLVGKKLGRAYKRVRAKRLVREFFRLNRDDFPNCDALIFTLERALDDEVEFKREMGELWTMASAACALKPGRKNSIEKSQDQ